MFGGRLPLAANIYIGFLNLFSRGLLLVIVTSLLQTFVFRYGIVHLYINNSFSKWKILNQLSMNILSVNISVISWDNSGREQKYTLPVCCLLLQNQPMTVHNRYFTTPKCNLLFQVIIS